MNNYFKQVIGNQLIINDFIILFTARNRFLIRKSLGKGILVSFAGSVLFVLISLLGTLVINQHLDGDTILFLFGCTGLAAFIIVLFPATLCVAAFTLRLQSIQVKDKQAKRRFVIEGALLGGAVSLCIGIFFSFLNWLLIASIGKGSMFGVTVFTIEGVIVGTIMDSTTAFFLANHKIDHK